MTNPWLALARNTKCQTLAITMKRHGITADEAERMTDEQWATVAKCAGTKPPSDAVKQMVIAQLQPVPELTDLDWARISQ